MIGSLSDFLILVIVAILLLGGSNEADIKNTIKNFSRVLTEFKQRRAELETELRRELGQVTGPLNEVSLSINSEIHRQPYSTVNYYDGKDDRIRELEERIKLLEQELQRMRGSKDGNGQSKK
ncbi:MAG: translocase [Sulfolobus sp.]|nr:translocase [Sulfolobus sp.]